MHRQPARACGALQRAVPYIAHSTMAHRALTILAGAGARARLPGGRDATATGATRHHATHAMEHDVMMSWWVVVVRQCSAVELQLQYVLQLQLQLRSSIAEPCGTTMQPVTPMQPVTTH